VKNTEIMRNYAISRDKLTLGVAVAFVGVLVRKHLPESYTPTNQDDSKMPIINIFQKDLKTFITVFFLNIIFAVGFYTVFIYNPIWMQKFIHTSKSYSLEINSISLFITIIAIFISSYFSNKVGRKPILLFATATITLFSYPLYGMMLGNVYHHALIGQAIFAILIGMFMGVVGIVMVELFKSDIRMSAISISFNLCFAIFGGTAPMIATWLIHTTHNNLSIAWYLSMASLISFIAILTIPETYKKNLNE